MATSAGAGSAEIHWRLTPDTADLPRQGEHGATHRPGRLVRHGGRRRAVVVPALCVIAGTINRNDRVVLRWRTKRLASERGVPSGRPENRDGGETGFLGGERADGVEVRHGVKLAPRAPPEQRAGDRHRDQGDPAPPHHRRPHRVLGGAPRSRFRTLSTTSVAGWYSTTARSPPGIERGGTNALLRYGTKTSAMSVACDHRANGRVCLVSSSSFRCRGFGSVFEGAL